MNEDRFDALDFARYVSARWRIVAVSCGVAVGLAVLAGFVLPRRYTATASLLIAPPAGGDSRNATAVSPVYLESLKTYEHLAGSDSLFLHALDHLNIRQKLADQSVESLKRRILKIEKPLNTRIIEISATLDDPHDAQALAQYIAEQAVALNHSLDQNTSANVTRDAEAMLAVAAARVESAQKASNEFAAKEAPGALGSEVQNASDLRYKIDRDLADLRADLVGTTAPADGLKARIADLSAQSARLSQDIVSKSRQLDRLQQRHDFLDNELHAARGNFEAARGKLEDIRTSSAFRSEGLDVLDPGIIPQRPSWPNTPLNVVLAFLISLPCALGWLAFGFGYERTQIARAEHAYSLR